MSMAVIWVAMVVVSVLFGAATGRAEAVGAAAMEGASAAVTLCLTTGGIICLWTGVMEVMRRSDLLAALSSALRPLLARLFPQASRGSETLEALSGNVSANLLGLGNAATPMGIKAASGMVRLSSSGEASDELCRLVVMNTASIQLLPTTVAGIRAAAGSAAAFDILPAVWITSVASLSAGLIACRIFSRLGRK